MTAGSGSPGASGHNGSAQAPYGGIDLVEVALAHDELADLDPPARRLALRRVLAEWLDGDDLARATGELADRIDGYGPLARLMEDDGVTDVLVNGSQEVWVERAGVLERAPQPFGSEEELSAWARRLLTQAGSRADAGRPIADARLSDGTRLHVVMPPVAPGGPLVSLRRWPARRHALDDLVGQRMLAGDQAAALRELVEARCSIAISGATGTGKTTLLNALLDFVGPGERVVTIEEIPELDPRCPHSVSLVARPPNVEGRGEVTLADLVRASLRMRPDRIVIGEVRGPEALAVLQAMSTGHEGSMVTIHARTPQDALDRLVTLALQASTLASEDALERHARRAVDVVVQLARDRDGTRKLRSIEKVE